VIDELVLAVLEPSVRSEAVTVLLPAVLNVMLKATVPPTKAVFAGKLALLSAELIPTVSVDVLTRFQFASTALTVALKDAPAVCGEGVPVLPVALPGAAVSPGTRTCNLLKTPALTVIDELVLARMATWVTSEAVTVVLPAVLRVRLKTLVPLVNAAFTGNVAFASLEVIATVSFVLTIFQFASTALTVTLKAAPEF
jgi:hypothetical protein